jgi:LysR family hydrogen peroxide-inducible transcriptional activator
LLEDGHCLRDQALAFCATATRGRMAGGGAGTVFGASSLNTVIQMVAGGYGVTLIPQIAADVERRDIRVKFLRLKNPEPGPLDRSGVPSHLARASGFCRIGESGEGERGASASSSSLRA